MQKNSFKKKCERKKLHSNFIKEKDILLTLQMFSVTS